MAWALTTIQPHRKSGARVAPSPYPRLAFHGLRFGQLLAAVIVSGIMCYFMYYLHVEHYAIPWTFITLLTISIITMASLLVTIILYNFTYLSPRFNVLLNGAMSLGWCLGLGLLSWSLSATLKKHCDVKTWGSKPAAAICRDYKALWAFTLVGTISTLLALALDIHTNQKATKSGVYVSPEDDKDANDLKPLKVRSQAYEVPEEQKDFSETPFEEADTEYHSRYGASQEIQRGALESRDIRYHDKVFHD